MVTNKRSKVVKYRAHTTHGGGHRKKRRGAGNRGGRGNAGSGKRGKAKKQSHPNLGKHGFVPGGRKTKTKSLNLSLLNKLVENGKIEAKEGVIDLTSSYQKLLGTGQAKKFNIKVDSCSKKAQEKVEAAGGKIISNTEE
jgi:large subunit ribosomal protein L15